MKTQNLLIAAGATITFLMGNLPSIVQAQNHRIITHEIPTVNANAYMIAQKVNPEDLTDDEVKAIIKAANSSDKGTSVLAVKILKKYYKDLTDDQKKLIKDGVKNKEDKEKITGEKAPQPAPNPEKPTDTQTNLTPNLEFETFRDSDVPVPMQ